MTELAPDPRPSPTRGQRGRSLLFEAVQTIVLTILIFLGIQTFVAQPFQVEGGSMETTLLPGEYVLVDKLTPRWATYERGDIVVLDPPLQLSSEGSAPFIKRVIGLPGDHVELKDGLVYINGSALDEPYVFIEDGDRQPTEPTGGGTAWTVPEGELLVFGDHRRESADSRSFGPVEISHVLGRAWLRYWPVDVFGVLN